MDTVSDTSPGDNPFDPQEEPQEERRRPKDTNWPKISRIVPTLKEQQPYPVDALEQLSPFMHGVALAIQALAGSSLPTAATTLIAAMGALAQYDYRVQTLDPVPKPVSVFGLVSTRSGCRKSTVASLLWQPHYDADTQARQIWLDLKEEQAKARKKEQDDGPMARKFSPVLIRSDATIEALLSRLAEGRPVQSLMTQDANAQLGGWSHSGEHGSRTLSYFCLIWDGSVLQIDRQVSDREQRIDAYACGLSFLGTWDVMDGFIVSESAGQGGFAARCLVSRDDHRPARDRDSNESDRSWCNHYRKVVQYVREMQDAGWEYERLTWSAKHLVEMDPAVTMALRDWGKRMEVEADALVVDGGTPHLIAWTERAAEHAARLAALGAAVEEYQANFLQEEQPSDLEIDLPLITAAIELADWYRQEMGRIAESSDVAELGKDAMALSVKLAEFCKGEDTRYWDESGGFLLNSFAAQRGPTRVRKDPEWRGRVLECLIDNQYIRPVGGKPGRFELHPRLRLE